MRLTLSAAMDDESATLKQRKVYENAANSDATRSFLHCESDGCDTFLDNVTKEGVVMMQQFCPKCEAEGGLENEHQDGGHDTEPHLECPMCIEAVETDAVCKHCERTRDICRMALDVCLRTIPNIQDAMVDVLGVAKQVTAELKSTKKRCKADETVAEG